MQPATATAQAAVARPPPDANQEITFFRQRVDITTSGRARDVLVSLNRGPGQRVGRGTHVVERVTIGTGEALIIRVTGEQPGTAVIAGSATISPEILHAGPQLVLGEDVTDRTETVVLVRDLTGDGRPDVVVGQRRPELTLCGLGSPLTNTRAISPTTLRLNAVSMDPTASLATAPTTPVRTVAAIPVDANVSLLAVPLLGGTARSVGGSLGSPATQLTDGHPNTVWPGNMHDFAVMRVLPSDLAVERLVFTVPPLPAQFARELMLVVGTQRIHVTINEALTRVPGARIAVPLVPSIAAGCIAVVYSGAHPSQAIAGLTATSELDRTEHPIETMVQALNGEQGERATGVLLALGDRSVSALLAGFGTLNSQGARRAMRILSSHPTGESAEALVLALGRDETEVAAREALVRMGPVAYPALARLSITDSRAVTILRAMRGDVALRADASVHVLESDPAVWRDARGPLQALLGEMPTQQALLTWVNNWTNSVVERDRRAAYRALSVGFTAAQDDETRARISERSLALRSDVFGEQFLRLSSLGGTTDGQAELAQILRSDNDSDLRDEAARVLVSLIARVPTVREQLGRALTDQTPRVRMTAVQGLRGDERSRILIEGALHNDRWPTVRAAAAESLIGMTTASAALLTALDDPSLIVVRATLNALAQTPGAAAGPSLLAFIRDTHRHPDLRVEALAAIGQRCDQSAIQALEELAIDRIDPALPDHEQRVGHAALGTIARLNPARARAFLQRMDGNSFAAAAVERAARNSCPVSPLAPIRAVTP